MNADTKPSRVNDPERTCQDILDAATEEFSDKGLSGARVDEIAAKTRTSKRMIYYYFGSKEGLYLAVLENAYRKIRLSEAKLELDALPAAQAIRELVTFTFHYHRENADFVRLVMNENIHRGEFINQSQVIRELNTPAIDHVRRIYERGVASGEFRAGIDPVDIHMTISALSFYNVSNSYTFSQIFERDMKSDDAIAARRDVVADLVLRFLRP